jgi:UDP-N-acetylmuramoyl-tripeptide--D-alanyl-D-alanine ligase
MGHSADRPAWPRRVFRGVITRLGMARDFLRLLPAPPAQRAIFLRSEYDRLYPLLRPLATGHRRVRLRRTRLVAVIGSLGKTTTRRVVHAALDCPDRGFAISNYGASLAANLLRVRPGDRYAVLEAGIAGPGAMAGIAGMLRPDVVVVTSIRSDHNRSFPTLLDTRAEKVRIVSALAPGGTAYLNGDDPHVRWMATQTRARVVTFGMDAGNDVRAVELHADGDGLSFGVRADSQVIPVRSRLLGEHMVYPLLAAVAILLREGLDVRAALPRLAGVAPADSRMELVTLPDGTRIIDDAAKAGIESIRVALATFAAIPAPRKVAVIGPIEEPQGRPRDLYREIGRALAQCADRIIVMGGDDLRAVRAGAVGAGMNPEAIHVLGMDIGGTMDLARAAIRPGDLVLVKGAFARRLRRVVLALMGREVTCRVRGCRVKVVGCDHCPLLDADASAHRNHFIRRYLDP